MRKPKTAPLRAVVYREEPSAVAIYPDVVEEYECGHVENHAPVKPAKRRRCGRCAEAPRGPEGK